MHKSFTGIVIPEGVKDAVCSDSGRMADIATRKPLTQYHNIRRYTGILCGKKFAGSTKARGNLIKYQQNLKFIA